MRIYYNKLHLRTNLIIGLAFLLFSIISFFLKETIGWNDYGWYVITLTYLILYAYKKRYGYVSIDNGYIKINKIFGKGIRLDEIVQIKKFAGDYILRTANDEIVINSQIMEPDSLQELDTVLEGLNVETK